MFTIGSQKFLLHTATPGLFIPASSLSLQRYMELTRAFDRLNSSCSPFLLHLKVNFLMHILSHALKLFLVFLFRSCFIFTFLLS